MTLAERQLKIKIKTLAFEAKCIRKEERKEFSQNEYFKQKFNSGLAAHHISSYETLRNHRVCDVRHESRATQLAYALIRNKNYNDVESPYTEKESMESVLSRVVDMVYKYKYRRVAKKSDVHEEVTLWMSFPEDNMKLAA